MTPRNKSRIKLRPFKSDPSNRRRTMAIHDKRSLLVALNKHNHGACREAIAAIQGFPSNDLEALWYSLSEDYGWVLWFIEARLGPFHPLNEKIKLLMADEPLYDRTTKPLEAVPLKLLMSPRRQYRLHLHSIWLDVEYPSPLGWGRL